MNIYENNPNLSSKNIRVNSGRHQRNLAREKHSVAARRTDRVRRLQAVLHKHKANRHCRSPARWAGCTYRRSDARLSRGYAALNAGRIDMEDEWKPIETAPQGGEMFLGYRDGKVRDACRVPRSDCEMWVFGGLSGGAWLKPTHWRPLPPAPRAE